MRDETRQTGHHPADTSTSRDRYIRAMERLVAVVQELSLARSLERVQEIVRRAARELTGADGATFVLRDGDYCFYADEDAIAPLWKGKRFPMGACISGWAMRHRELAVIEDIYADPRVPADAYRPTFVKSLAMVPIRKREPIGAIGNYWASPHLARPEELRLLQALADSTSIALENVQLYAELEARVRERTAELTAANQELEAFSYSVSHDLRTPLVAIGGFARLLEARSGDRLDGEARRFIEAIRQGVHTMDALISDLLSLSKAGRKAIEPEKIDMTELARAAFEAVVPRAERRIDFRLAPLPPAEGDGSLLRQVWVNLLSNAIKYSATRPTPVIEVAGDEGDGETRYHVVDNGIGFDDRFAEQIFAPFRRLHPSGQFEGTGVGLAIVRRIVDRHRGTIRAEGTVDGGARFTFTLPRAPGVARDGLGPSGETVSEVTRRSS